jgi:hypothetical protein
LQEDSDDESKQDQLQNISYKDANIHNKVDQNQQISDNMSITRSATAKFIEPAEYQIQTKELPHKSIDKDTHQTSEELIVSTMQNLQNYDQNSDLQENSMKSPSELQELYAYYQVNFTSKNGSLRLL